MESFTFFFLNFEVHIRDNENMFLLRILIDCNTSPHWVGSCLEGDGVKAVMGGEA